MLKSLWCWLFHSSHWIHTKRLTRSCALCGRVWPIPMDPALKSSFDEVERLRASWAQQTVLSQERRAREAKALREYVLKSTAAVESRRGATTGKDKPS